MQHRFRLRRAVNAAAAGLGVLLVAGPARADLAVAPSCSSVPLVAEIDRAAAAAALPTFVGTEQICVLQALLATVGTLPGSREVDGRYDRQTRDALKDFQLANGLSSNGLLTPSTMEVLATSALDEIYAPEPVAADEPVMAVTDAEEPSVQEAISDQLAALELEAPTSAPVLNLAPVQNVIDLPVLATDADGAISPSTEAVEDEQPLAALAGSTGATVVVETTTIETVTTEEYLTTGPAGSAAAITESVGEPVTTSIETTVVETYEAPQNTNNLWGNFFDPLSDKTVATFVEPSFCHSPSHARDLDLLRNLERLPVATCLRTFVGAGNLPYQIYSLEVSAGGQTIVLMHDGDDAAFDAAIGVLGDFGGRMIVMQSGEYTRTTLEGSNPEIMAVSPASNLSCDLRSSETPLAAAVHDYIVAGATPVLVLRQNQTGQSALDRFSTGAQRFDLNAMGPERELFDPSIEPIADDAFIELMVTSASRRSIDTRMLVQRGIEAGMPVALTLVDALGQRDQCSIEALALQTDQPVTRLLLGKAKGAQLDEMLAAAYRAIGLFRRGASISQPEERQPEIDTDGDIPASILALAAGGLDADLNEELAAGQSTPRTLIDALAPGLPPLPLGRPGTAAEEEMLLAAVETSANRTPTNRVVTGISAGSGVDALAPVALDDSATPLAAVSELIVEEAVGPVSALPPSPLLRPSSDFAHRFVPDGIDPIIAMDGEAYYRGTNFLGNSTSSVGTTSIAPQQPSETIYTIDGQVYDPYAQPRVISSRTIQTTINPYAPAAPSTTQTYGVPVTTYATQQAAPSNVSGPLYGTQSTTPSTGVPATETIIINNTIY